jgi:oligopeptide transport system permease protein
MTEPALAARPADPATAPAPDVEETRGLWGDAWRQLRRRPLFWVASVIILVLLLMAFAPSLFTSVDPRATDLAGSGTEPGPGAVFGRDLQGHDVYARAVYGAGPTLAVGVLSTLGTVLVGALAGLLGGFRGGWPDSLLSRFAEIFAGLPFVLGGIVILTTSNPPGQLVGETRLIL